MDTQSIIDQFKDTDTVTLYQLKLALEKELCEHERMEAVRQSLYSGQTINYFCAKQKKVVAGTVVQIQRTQVEILIPNSTSTTMVPLSAIKTQQPEKQSHSDEVREAMVEKMQFKLGQRVKFTDRQNKQHIAEITRLHDKTASLIEEGGDKWRVGYHYLDTFSDRTSSRSN